MFVQVRDPSNGEVSVYLLSPQDMDRAGETNTKCELPLLLHANPENAADTFPVTLGGLNSIGKTSALLAADRSVDESLAVEVDATEAAQPKEVVVEKIVEKVVERFETREVDVLSEIDVAEMSNAYLLKDGDLNFSDEYINDIRIKTSEDINGYVADVILKNTTRRPYRPSIKFTILNKYGMRLGSTYIHWTTWEIAPGDRKQESAVFESAPIHEDLFRYSKLGPVDGFDDPYCIIIRHAQHGDEKKSSSKKIGGNERRAFGMARGYVIENLKGSSSISFGSASTRDSQDPAKVTKHLGDNQYRIQAWVKSGDSPDSILKKGFTCTVKENDDGSWECVSISLDE